MAPRFTMPVCGTWKRGQTKKEECERVDEMRINPRIRKVFAPSLRNNGKRGNWPHWYVWNRKNLVAFGNFSHCRFWNTFPARWRTIAHRGLRNICRSLSTRMMSVHFRSVKRAVSKESFFSWFPRWLEDRCSFKRRRQSPYAEACPFPSLLNASVKSVGLVLSVSARFLLVL